VEKNWSNIFKLNFKSPTPISVYKACKYTEVRVLVFYIFSHAYSSCSMCIIYVWKTENSLSSVMDIFYCDGPLFLATSFGRKNNIIARAIVYAIKKIPPTRTAPNRIAPQWIQLIHNVSHIPIYRFKDILDPCVIIRWQRPTVLRVRG